LNGLQFRRQQIIDSYIVDFYCHAQALIVEVDGDIHDLQQDYDAERDSHLTARGFRILRVSNDDVKDNLLTVLQKISEACC
jgi:very-short-patch-repair endonuclease